VASERRPRKDKKPHYKRQKIRRDKSLDGRGASPSPRSDFSQSDGSDEEMAACPAERCQQPEGDEVTLRQHFRASEMFVVAVTKAKGRICFGSGPTWAEAR